MNPVDGSARKDAIGDAGKPPLSLVPKSLGDAAAAAFGYGARKYEAHNWRRGMAWSEAYSALLRHLTAWNEGEDLDSESGLHHLAHAAACLAFLTTYAADTAYAQFDDRWRPQ